MFAIYLLQWAIHVNFSRLSGPSLPPISRPEAAQHQTAVVAAMGRSATSAGPNL